VIDKDVAAVEKNQRGGATMPAQRTNQAERVFGMFKTMLLIREFEPRGRV